MSKMIKYWPIVASFIICSIAFCTYVYSFGQMSEKLEQTIQVASGNKQDIKVVANETKTVEVKSSVNENTISIIKDDLAEIKKTQEKILDILLQRSKK